ncbi:MAG: glycosyltransferase family 4 protein [Acidimicrobiia bacterium]|nr:glycosyltransferase family 4 protein [Acidimicrobiia bacterium]
MTQRPLHIAMLGSRGVPATFGGVEHHVEALGRRLVERGHEVTVFCQSTYHRGEHGGRGEGPDGDGERLTEYRGMRLVAVPVVSSKHLEALTHSARSTFTAMRARFDIIHYHSVGPGVFSFVPRFLGRAKVVQTIHGLDAERAKWGRAATAMLRTATWLSARVPDVTVTVSQALADHYRQRYGRTCVAIPNGLEARPRPAARLITERYGLSAGSYVLFVGRLVPEKCPDLLVRAFRDVPGDRRLVFAGGTSYTDDFLTRLEAEAARDPRVLLAGYVYGEALDELYANAAAFVQPSALEGLPLTLLEAIGSERPAIASDIPPHCEVLERDRAGGRLFHDGDKAGLTKVLTAVLADPETESRGAIELAAGVRRRYDWDAATDQLVDLYRSVMA